MKRTIILTAVATMLLAAPDARPQDRQKFKCSGPAVTREDARRIGGVGAWTAATSGADGILSFTHCEYFKEGTTEITRIDPGRMFGLPEELADLDARARPLGLGISVRGLPAGFRVYRDLVFEVRTTAVSSGPHPVEFRIPSVSTEEEFKKLRVLYLGESGMDPGSLVWHGLPYPELDVSAPDFGRRTITAGVEFVRVFHRRATVGRFVVTTFAREEYERSPAADLEIRNPEAPASARVGESLTFAVTVVNRGPAPASDIVFNHITGPHAEFVSAQAGQGRCGKSVNTDSVTVCRLGTMAPGASVKVVVTVKVGNNLLIAYHGGVPHLTMNTVAARERDANPGNNRLDTKSTTLVR